MLFHSLFILIFATNAGAANPLCPPKNAQIQQLTDITRIQCEETKREPQCKQLYKMIQDDGGDVKAKALDCTGENSIGFGLVGEWVTGCLWDNTAGMIGEELSKANARKAEADLKLAQCNGDPKIKENIFTAYNSTVPKLLQVKEPSSEKLQASNCQQIQRDLIRAKGLREKYVGLHVEYNSFNRPEPFTAEEKEYLAWKKKHDESMNPIRSPNASDQGLLDKAYEKLGEFGVRLECYNSRAAAALACEAISAFAGGYGLARVAVMAGLRTVRLTAAISDLKAIGREARIATAEAEIAPLSESQKLAKLNQELHRGKDLNETEVTAYEKAHKVGQDKGETYGHYSGDSLREKKRILMEEGGFSEKEADFMILRGYVGTARQDFVNATIVAGKKFFGVELSWAKAEAIANYRESLMNVGKRQAAIDGMRASGLTESQIKAVIDGSFFSGKPNVVAPINVAANAKPPPPPPAPVAPPPPAPPSIPRPPTNIPSPQKPPADIIEKAGVTGNVDPKEAKAHFAALVKNYDPKYGPGMRPSVKEELESMVMYKQVDSATEVVRNIKAKLASTALQPTERARLEQSLRAAQNRCHGMVAYSLAVGWVGDNFQREIKRRISLSCDN